MERITGKIGSFLTEQKQHKRRAVLFACLAVLVLYGTVTGLKLYGQAMNHKRDVLECGFEVHEHDEACRDDGTLICGYADYVVHEHDELCYDWNGKLACTLGEHELHEHDEDCYKEARTLACGEKEGSGARKTEKTATSGDAERELTCGKEEHVHDSGCYSDGEGCGKSEHIHSEACGTRTLACGESEHAHSDACRSRTLSCGESEHSHGDSCYDEDGELACGRDEHSHDDGCYETSDCDRSEHTHDDSCYEVSYCDKEEHTHDGSCAGGSELTCGLKEHEHDDGCWSDAADDDGEDEAPAGHAHDEDCYEVKEKLVCKELELHEHDDDCFDEDGNWICGELELLEHQHDEGCLVTKELTPEEIEGIGEAERHMHSNECYGEDGELICGYPAAHAHEDRCYGEDGELICGYETEEHVHVDKCYDVDGNLICGYAGKSHIHDGSCYDGKGNLVCGYEAAAHKHTDECYDEDGNLICGYESEKHFHMDGCYDEDGNLICGFEAERHYHTKDCYENGKPACGYGSYYHPHTADCYDRNGDLICGYEAEKHVHGYDCYDADGNVICGYAALGHEHDESCYDEDGNLICGFDESGERIIPIYCLEYVHSHTKLCYEGGELVCGKADWFIHKHDMTCRDEDHKLICPVLEKSGDAHEHGDGCYEDGKLACGELEILEHTHSVDCTHPAEDAELVRVYEGDGYIVTAEFTADANIPKDAEFTAELVIDDDTDATGHYGKRLDEYRESVGDKFATMKVLMKLGFYLDGEEIEPDAPVKITVQFLDEDDRADGKPLTVVHFGDDGAEKLDSEDADGKTVFSMDKFSEIALGYGAESIAVPVDFEVEYDAGDLKVVLSVKGEAGVPASGTDANEDGGAAGGPSGGTDGDGVQVTPVESDLIDGLSFRVGPLEEGSEGYEALLAYAADMDDTDGEAGYDPEAELMLKGWGFALLSGDAEADLSLCDIKAAITPSEELAQAASNAAEAISGDAADGAPAAEGYVLAVFGINTMAEPDEEAEDGACSIGDVETADMSSGDTGTVTLDLTGMTAFGARVSGQPNPHFTVQYYAKLDVLAETGSNALTMIDTSGGNLPKNKGNTSAEPTGSSKYMYVDGSGHVQTDEKVTEVYLSRQFEYHRAPTVNYMDALVENSNYEMKEIWVLKQAGEGEAPKDPESTNEADWDIYSCEDELHMTNREVSAETGEYIFIADGAVLRFVYDTTEKETDFSAAFYDYDISNGRVHRAKPPENPNQYVYKTAGQTFSGDSLTGEVLQWAAGMRGWDGHLYAYTKEQGINSSDNYSGSGTKLAFGNVNTGTNLGKLTWQSNELNKYNNKGYQGCTFGLVTGMSGGRIQYASGVNAPKLFNEGSATGKTAYSDYSLKFNRVGDTYTLRAVNGTGATGLDGFSNPRNSTGTHTDIWTNNFWPMDSAPSFGTGTHDVKFGGTATFKGGTHEVRFGPITQRGTDYTFPESDDGQYHNSYFGMQYEVEFDLAEDYVGPLEYYFFGDDDMWVFLDGKLVCDIGGVHSSVGEYVDLWDYLHVHNTKDGCFAVDEDGNFVLDENKQRVVACEKDVTDGKHTLSFFYTERGASGSTCWMQFTLPSVSSLTPETVDKDYGQLKVMKTVVGVNGDGEKIPETDSGDEFMFRIHLTDTEGNNLPDDYSYVKYDRNGREMGYDLIIWDGGEFTLKNGEYIVIKYLPAGTQYEVEELAGALTAFGTVSGMEYRTDVKDMDKMGEGYDGENPPEDPGIDPVPMTDLEAEKTAVGTIPAGNTAEVTYVNKFYVYGLPETGGAGTIWYAFAGALAVLAGLACLTYRKRKTGR